MKLILLLLMLPFLAHSQKVTLDDLSFDGAGPIRVIEDGEWLRITSNDEVRTRQDTAYGYIIFLNGWEILVARGIRIYDIEQVFTAVECPEGRSGCLVLHHGWVDHIVNTTYNTGSECIDEKYLLKFIPD